MLSTRDICNFVECLRHKFIPVIAYPYKTLFLQPTYFFLTNNSKSFKQELSVRSIFSCPLDCTVN